MDKHIRKTIKSMLRPFSAYAAFSIFLWAMPKASLRNSVGGKYYFSTSQNKQFYSKVIGKQNKMYEEKRTMNIILPQCVVIVLPTL